MTVNPQHLSIDYVPPPTPDRDPLEQSNTLSRLAKKYGNPEGITKAPWGGSLNHGILTGTGKSGLTPLSPWSTTQHSETNALSRSYLYFYQKARLWGFSAAELKTMHSLSALEDGPLMGTRFTNPIHPLFARSQWIDSPTSPLIPLGAGFEGFWEVC
jgi:hypothetical protein